MRRLTAVIITLNEEKKIFSCLESLKTVCEEIIVGDTGSTDKTKEIIIKNFPDVRIVDLVWNGYSETKNKLSLLSSNDLILSLDADEVLTPELQKSILEFKNTEADFGRFNRKTNYCGKWINYSGWYPDKKTRIYNRKIAQWEGSIHEKIAPLNGTLLHLNGNCLHYSIDSIEDHIRTLNIYTTLSAHEEYAQGKRGSKLKLLFILPLRFPYFYLIKLGILDGYYGFIISAISSAGKFIKEVKLIELEKNNHG